MDHRESQPSAFADPLGREEWLDGPRRNRVVHAATRVLHGDPDVGARRKLASLRWLGSLYVRGDAQHSTALHRVPSVHAQVQDRHLELIGVRLRRRQVLGDIDQHLDLRSGGAVDELGHTPDEGADVHWLRLERLPPREGQQPMDDGFGPLGRLQGARDPALPPLALSPAPLQQVESRDGEKIVEVVSYAARELTHRLQLLGLSKGGFGLGQALLVAQPIRHVIDELVGAEPASLLVAGRTDS